MRQVQIGPPGELVFGFRKGAPAVAMHDEERRSETRPILASRTFEQERAWHLITSIEKVCKHCRQGKLARIEPHVAMQNAFFRADARFMFPPEIARI